MDVFLRIEGAIERYFFRSVIQGLEFVDASKDKEHFLMNRMRPLEMAGRVSKGLLCFPTTHFGENLEFAPGPYREHIAWQISNSPSGLFVAGGTGEFFSLTPAEFATVVKTAVVEADKEVPVVAGCGYGTAMAKEFAKAAEESGADGILLLPPYLLHAEQAGLAAHVEAVCASTRLGVILYNRDNAVLDEITIEQLCEKCPNLVGFKDGVGDIERMTSIRTRMGDRLIYINGLPTAEMFALPYMQMGVTTYSSAIFNFLPKFALSFYAAACRRDFETITRSLRDFIVPYRNLRNRRKGYAVSIVKAGMKAMGRSAGPVRPPLMDLTEGEFEELSILLEGKS